MVIDASLSGLVYIAVSVFLPIVVAVVTKQETLGKYKSYVLLALSGLTSVGLAWHTALEAGQEFEWKGVVIGAVVTFSIAAATYAGLWKPTEIAAETQAKTAGFGI